MNARVHTHDLCTLTVPLLGLTRFMDTQRCMHARTHTYFLQFGSATAGLNTAHGLAQTHGCAHPHGVLACRVTWNTLIWGFAHSGDIRRAEAAMAQARVQGCPPDASAWSSLLHVSRCLLWPQHAFAAHCVQQVAAGIAQASLPPIALAGWLWPCCCCSCCYLCRLCACMGTPVRYPRARVRLAPQALLQRLLCSLG